MYASAIPIATFERGGVCITADYYDPVVTSAKVSFAVTNSEK